MLHTILCKLVPIPTNAKPIVQHQGVKFSFDVLERAYLIHWSLGVETAMAVFVAVTITIIVIKAVGSDMD